MKIIHVNSKTIHSRQMQAQKVVYTKLKLGGFIKKNLVGVKIVSFSEITRL